MKHLFLVCIYPKPWPLLILSKVLYLPDHTRYACRTQTTMSDIQKGHLFATLLLGELQHCPHLKIRQLHPNQQSCNASTARSVTAFKSHSLQLDLLEAVWGTQYQFCLDTHQLHCQAHYPVQVYIFEDVMPFILKWCQSAVKAHKWWFYKCHILQITTN